MSFSYSITVNHPRKRKWCYWCGERCPVGEPRVRSVWTFEGDFATGHYHPECNTARSAWRELPENRQEHEDPPEGAMQRGMTLPKLSIDA